MGFINNKARLSFTSATFRNHGFCRVSQLLITEKPGNRFMLSARLLLHPGAWEDIHELSSSNGHTGRRLPKVYLQQSGNVQLQILMEGPMVLGQPPSTLKPAGAG